MSVFTALKNSVDEVGVHLATAANQARKSVINIKDRIEAEHREIINPGERYGPLWEPPENVEVKIFLTHFFLTPLIQLLAPSLDLFS